MPRKAQPLLTRFELEVMDVLWRLQTASVRQIQEALPRKKRPAYTTVHTIVQRLLHKNAVRVVTEEAKAHVFAPLLRRQRAYRRLIDDFLGLFGGSAQPLAAHLVESGQLTLADIRSMEELAKTLRRARRVKPKD